MKKKYATITLDHSENSADVKSVIGRFGMVTIGELISDLQFEIKRGRIDNSTPILWMDDTNTYNPVYATFSVDTHEYEE